MIAIPGFIAILLRLALMPLLPPPEPKVHDEFSYLLGADTFAHGRLTNPSHPHWRFFETIQVISVPTYASKYPPGQALLLAVGQKLSGHPFGGVLLGGGFLCAAVTWMLLAWVPPGLALVGGIFTAVAFGPGHYWTESYWGGAVATGASALLLGAFGRVRRRGRLTAAWPFAIGVALLWITRPFEGGFLVLSVVGLLIWLAARGRIAREWHGPQFVATLAGCVAMTLAWQGYYNWRVTGDALQIPYLLYQRQYVHAPILWFQPVRAPAFDAGPVLRSFHAGSEIRTYQEETSGSVLRRLRHLLFRTWGRRGSASVAFGLNWPIVAVLLPLSWRFRRDRGLRLLWVITLACAFPFLLTVWNFAHYLAGLVATLLLVVFRVAWRLRQRHAAASALLLCALFSMALASNGATALRAIRSPGTAFPYPLVRAVHAFDRGRISRDLAAQRGLHVVFVRYSPAHYPHAEWVYNGADIDRQPVIWARDLGDDENVVLIRHYPGRRFWVLDADEDPPSLRSLVAGPES